MRLSRLKFLLLVVAVLAAGWFAADRFGEHGEPSLLPAPSVARSTPSAALPSPSTQVPELPPVAPPPTQVAFAPAPPVAAAATGYPPMSLDEVLRPDSRFQDDVFGVSVTFPEGWSVATARRWGEGNRENTVFFKPPEPFAVQPSMYYQAFREPPPDRNQAEAYLREIAQGKENSRSGNGANDYKNVPGSFAYREINGHPALSYSAVYTQTAR